MASKKPTVKKTESKAVETIPMEQYKALLNRVCATQNLVNLELQMMDWDIRKKEAELTRLYAAAENLKIELEVLNQRKNQLTR